MMKEVLRHYEGRYLLDWDWKDGMNISRFLNVKGAGDHLSIEYETVTYPIGAGFLPINHPVVERRVNERQSLTATSEHSFDVSGDPRSYRFVPGEIDSTRSVIVIQDGISSEPCPLFVPLPEEIPGRRERFEWLDLGHPQLCMTAQNTGSVIRFYKQLGFVHDPRVTNDPDPETSGVVSQGRNVLAFLDFQPQPCINYRGPSILETGVELARRGYVLADGRVETNHIRGDETGGFMVYDPDGHRMFFNTHAPERPVYEAWKNGILEPGAGSHHEQNPVDVPESLPLGQLVVCLDVTDLNASTSFYRGMGFAFIDQSQNSAMLFSRPARKNRYAFPLRLQLATEPSCSFGFLCSNVESVSAAIKARGIEITTTSDGPAFVDPDGNCVRLFEAFT